MPHISALLQRRSEPGEDNHARVKLCICKHVTAFEQKNKVVVLNRPMTIRIGESHDAIRVLPSSHYTYRLQSCQDIQQYSWILTTSSQLWPLRTLATANFKQYALSTTVRKAARDAAAS